MTKTELIAKLTTLYAAANVQLDGTDPELKHAKNEDLVNVALPLTMYETMYTYNNNSILTGGFVRPITVTRFGIDRSLGATSPSIDFTDSNGHKCLGFVGDFYLNKQDAQAEVDSCLAHAAKEKAKEQLHEMVDKYLPLLLAP